MVKPFALARRNFLFVRGGNGGTAMARISTLVQTATANGREPESYMAAVLREVWRGREAVASVLPWTEGREIEPL